jgi:type II secretory pathway pseudopilin PulG
MNFSHKRGMTGLEVAVAVAVVGLCGYLYTQVFAPGRNKKVADKTAVATAAAQQQAQEAKKEAEGVKVAATEAAAAHAKEIALRDQMDQNAAAFSAQAKAVLAADPKPSEYTLVAMGLLDSVETSLGVQFTAVQRAAFVARVVPLLQHNAEVEAALATEKANAAALAAGKEAEHAHAVASDVHVQQLATQLENKTGELTKTAIKAASLAQSNAAWANNEQTLWGRIKALVVLGVVLILVILGVSIKLRGVVKTKDTTVALVEKIKEWVAAGVKDVSDLKAKMKEWNGDDPSHEKAIATTKEKLRL